MSRSTQIVSAPVGTRLMSASATMAPTSAALAPMVSMAPMAAGWTPARNSFRVRTKNSALTLKLQSAAETVMARRNPRESKNRTPSAMSVRSVVGGWQLGRYGLIEGASGVSDGRERWWQPSASEGLRIEKAHLSATPQGEVALRAFRRHAAAYWQALIERFFAADHGQGVWESHDVPMLLTDQEARRCAGEVFEVLSKWNRRGQRSDPREDPPRRTYIGMALVMPHQTDLVERSSGRSPRSRSAALGPLDERGQRPPVDG